MRNLAIIINKLNDGGAERVASNLSIELFEFYNVKLIVFDGRDQAYPHGGELFDLKVPQQTNFIVRFIDLWKRIRIVRKIKQQEDIFCTISFLDGPNLVNIFTRRKDKVIVSIRNMLSKEPTGLIRKEYMKLICNQADKVVTPSKGVENDLVHSFNIKNHKILTIYNSCKKERLIELANIPQGLAVEFDPNIKYVVTMGRLTEQKGQWHLIRAFKKVIEKNPNTKLLILGEGELRQKLEKLSWDLGLKDNAVFTGYISNPHNIIKKCDVFAFPSIYEGLGNVLLESLAIEKAIVATDCDAGPREIFAPNTPVTKRTKVLEFGEYGILVPVGDRGHFNSYEPITEDEQILAEAILILLSDEKIKNNYERKTALRYLDFVPEKIIGQWRELIDSLTINH
jgi:glycosyltransferase involved in cell wall biosynthesis